METQENTLNRPKTGVRTGIYGGERVFTGYEWTRKTATAGESHTATDGVSGAILLRRPDPQWNRRAPWNYPSSRRYSYPRGHREGRGLWPGLQSLRNNCPAKEVRNGPGADRPVRPRASDRYMVSWERNPVAPVLRLSGGPRNAGT